jgi:hypothetical protein
MNSGGSGGTPNGDASASDGRDAAGDEAVRDVAADSSDGADIPVNSDIIGYWLWTEEVESGQVVRTITDDDMVPKVGPTGWSDCADRCLCTRWGIQKYAFGADGLVQYIENVHSSSDFHEKGSYGVSGDLITFTMTEHFSCAHPTQRSTDTRIGYARWRMQAGSLWVSVTEFDSSYPFFDSPPDNPTRWVVFRSIAFADYDNRYMIRLCQAATDDECHPDCFPERTAGYQ